MRGYLVWGFILVSVIMMTPRTALGQSKCSRPIPELFQQVSPSVVFVSAVAIDPFSITDRVSLVVGSGFIISTDGLVLTTSHVVFGSQAIRVILDDGRQTTAKLVGVDPILDLAVLRIPVPPERLPKVTFGDSAAIRVGDQVVAIGNPSFGLEQTLTLGVVSGLNRILPETPMSLTLPLIQTDAAINPGNSGGPLLNRCGEVIGINSAFLTQAEGIGFAVPINVAKRILPELVKYGRVIRPWLGVGGKIIGRELRAILKMPLVDGFLVETIEPGSPAAQAGLRGGHLPMRIAAEEFLLGGDIITVANGERLDSPERYVHFIHSLKIGGQVRLTLYRDGETRKVEFRLVERPLLPGDVPYGQRRVLSPMWGHGFGPRIIR